MLYEDDEQDDYNIPQDFIDRVEEAVRAVAWAGKLYRDIYGKDPDGTLSEALNTYIGVQDMYKADIAEETNDGRSD